MKNHYNFVWNGHDCNLISVKDYVKNGIHKILALIFYVDDIDGYDLDQNKISKKNGVARYVDANELNDTNNDAKYEGDNLYDLFYNYGKLEYWIEDDNYNWVNYE